MQMTPPKKDEDAWLQVSTPGSDTRSNGTQIQPTSGIIKRAKTKTSTATNITGQTNRPTSLADGRRDWTNCAVPFVSTITNPTNPTKANRASPIDVSFKFTNTDMKPATMQASKPIPVTQGSHDGFLPRI